jgi:hypothetical protein
MMLSDSSRLKEGTRVAVTYRCYIVWLNDPAPLRSRSSVPVAGVFSRADNPDVTVTTGVINGDIACYSNRFLVLRRDDGKRAAIHFDAITEIVPL